MSSSVANIYLHINNYEYLFSQFFSIFQACLQKQVFIPRFCYHSKLKISGNCRMCLVEEKKSVKPLASCSISITSGMILFTKTSLVKKSRESVIEYLLINHPLDCPICDQGGECDLQDQAMVFGSDRGRFYEYKKRSVENKNVSALIKTSLNRCIQCARCTRFLEKFSDKSSLVSLLGRGSKTEISSYSINFLKSEVSANIIDICPVGALTSKSYAFRARSWELFFVYSVDIFDSLGSNIRIDYRGTNIMRIIPKLNEKINSEWITDKIRFFFDSINLQRLLNPMLLIQSTGNYFSLNYKNIFFLIQNYLYLNISKNLVNSCQLKYNINSHFIGNFFDIYDSVFCKRFINLIGSNFSFLFQPIKNLNDFRYSYIFSRKLFNKNLSSKTMIFVATNPRFESPIVNMKIKNLPIKKISVIGFLSNLNYVFSHLGTSLNWILKATISANFIFISNYFNKNILFFFNYLYKTSKIVNFELLSLYLSDLGSFELNLSSAFGKHPGSWANLPHADFFSSGLNYSLSADDNNLQSFLNSKHRLMIYQGSHGEYLSNSASLIIPNQVFIDRPFVSLNLFGLVQSTDATFFRINRRSLFSDWQIFNKITSFLFNTKDLALTKYKLIRNYSPVVFSKTHTPLSQNLFSVNYFHFLKNKQFIVEFILTYKITHSLVNNLYQFNSFLRMSPTLSVHSRKFLINSDYIFTALSPRTISSF